MKHPNVFVAGMPKTGTTSLVSYLSQHPEVFVPEEKEPRHFCTDLIAESNRFHDDTSKYFRFRDDEAYRELYDDAEADHAVDGTVEYSFSDDAAENIKAFNDDARIILGFRHPLSFLTSYHAEQRLWSHETEASFSEALRMEEQRRDGANIPANAPYPSILYYSSWIRYDEHLERFLNRFSADQIYVYLYSDFKQDNEAVVRDIFSFLDVKRDVELKQVRSNKGKKVTNGLAKTVLSSPSVYHYTKTYLPQPVFTAAKNVFHAIFSEGRDSPETSAPEGVVSEARAMTERLQSLLDQHGLHDTDITNRWTYD